MKNIKFKKGAVKANRMLKHSVRPIKRPIKLPFMIKKKMRHLHHGTKSNKNLKNLILQPRHNSEIENKKIKHKSFF